MSKNKKRKQRKTQPKRPNQKIRRGNEQRVEAAVDCLFELAEDERVPPEKPAEVFLSVFSTEPVFDELVGVLVKATSAERAAAIGESAVQLEPRSIGALTLAAQAPELAGNDRRSADLYSRAVELDGGDRKLRWLRAASLVACNDGTATKQLAELCAEQPHDDLSEILYCDALEAAAERLSLDHDGPCPCGSGLAYGSCGFELDRDALADFRDRSQIEELWTALDEYARHDRYANSIEELRAQLFEGEHVDPTDAMNELFRAWVVALTGSELDDDSDEATIFWDFMHDKEIDPVMCLTATFVGTNERWGLWQLGPRRGPGAWLFDLVSACSHFVVLPADLTEVHAPWTVFLGPLTPNRGTWRARGGLIPLTPEEGDALADAVLEFADTVVEEEGSSRKKSAIFTELVDEGPPGVIVTRRPPLSPEISLFLTNVMCGGLPMLLESLGRMRSEPLGLANTDGEPLELFNVRIQIGDPDELRVALEGHPDISVKENVIVWLGRALSASEAATSTATLEAYAEREGVELMDQSDGPPRYIRAFIKIADGELITEVNSGARLEGLLELLEEAGVRPKVTSKVRIDPAMDWPSPGSFEPTDDRGMSAEAVAAWQEAWLDEEVPALGGLTPRKAAEDDYGRLDLESLLRTFEYRAAQQHAEGRAAVDVERLRLQLDMMSPLAFRSD